MFVGLGVALRLDEGVHGSLQQLPAETAVKLGDGVSWKNIKNHRARVTRLMKQKKKSRKKNNSQPIIYLVKIQYLHNCSANQTNITKNNQSPRLIRDALIIMF